MRFPPLQPGGDVLLRGFGATNRSICDPSNSLQPKARPTPYLIVFVFKTAGQHGDVDFLSKTGIRFGSKTSAITVYDGQFPRKETAPRRNAELKQGPRRVAFDVPVLPLAYARRHIRGK